MYESIALLSRDCIKVSGRHIYIYRVNGPEPVEVTIDAAYSCDN